MVEYDPLTVVTIRYKNHRGETADRRIIPIGIGFGTSQWHPEPQWTLCAHDLDKQADRSFAMADISEWRVAGGEGSKVDGLSSPDPCPRDGGHLPLPQRAMRGGICHL